MQWSDRNVKSLWLGSLLDSGGSVSITFKKWKMDMNVIADMEWGEIIPLFGVKGERVN